MRSAGSGFISMIAGEVTTLATLWKITRRDGEIFTFTDHTVDLVHNSETYVSSTGYSASATNNKSDFSVDSLDVQGVLNIEGITEADLLAGLFDFAEVTVKMINYEGNLDTDVMIINTGWLGEVSSKQNTFLSELRGLTERMQRSTGSYYSETCRALLGDSQCGYDLDSITEVGQLARVPMVPVTAVTNRQIFTASGLGQPNGYFSGGFVEWTSGANNGLSMEVKSFANGLITLVLPMAYTISISDGFTITTGCNKRFNTCVSKFNNAVNFRGEPHIPGFNKILETAYNNTGKRSS